MSEVVSPRAREVRKDKGNVGRLALLVAPIRDRIQLKPRFYTPRGGTTGGSDPHERFEGERKEEPGRMIFFRMVL